MHSYRQRYASSQWSKCCGLTRLRLVKGILEGKVSEVNLKQSGVFIRSKPKRGVTAYIIIRLRGRHFSEFQVSLL